MLVCANAGVEAAASPAAASHRVKRRDIGRILSVRLRGAPIVAAAEQRPSFPGTRWRVRETTRKHEGEHRSRAMLPPVLPLLCSVARVTAQLWQSRTREVLKTAVKTSQFFSRRSKPCRCRELPKLHLSRSRLAARSRAPNEASFPAARLHDRILLRARRRSKGGFGRLNPQFKLRLPERVIDIR
jgi:hypothetical protein